jgi:hypothetical protein
MPLYFYLLEASRFRAEIRPALAESWQQRSFAPCRTLCRQLLPAARSFANRYRLDPAEPLLIETFEAVPFDRHFWRLLAGEIFLLAAEVPEIQTAPESFCCLLAPDRYREESTLRVQFAPIQQIHHGSRDLVFGRAIYRPEQAGWNDRGDVVRLADYLATLKPERWTVADLAALREADDERERAEELEFLRDWYGPLRDMYERAATREQIVICES